MTQGFSYRMHMARDYRATRVALIEARAALVMAKRFIEVVEVPQHALGGNSVWPHPRRHFKEDTLAAIERCLPK